MVSPFLHGRLLRLLIFAPPVFGAILGGVAVNFIRFALYGAPAGSPDLGITIGFLVVSVVILVGVTVRSIQVWRGAVTAFPRAFRAAPFTSAGGLVLGVVAAWFAQAGR